MRGTNIDQYFSLFNNIVPASQLPLGSNYHLFKTGIEPKWEDVANANGGKWTVQFPAKQRANLDQMWLFAVRIKSVHWLFFRITFIRIFYTNNIFSV